MSYLDENRAKHSWKRGDSDRWEESQPLLSRTINLPSRSDSPPSGWHATGPTGRFKRSRPQIRIQGHGKPFPRKQGFISFLLLLSGVIFLGGKCLESDAGPELDVHDFFFCTLPLYSWGRHAHRRRPGISISFLHHVRNWYAPLSYVLSKFVALL